MDSILSPMERGCIFENSTTGTQDLFSIMLSRRLMILINRFCWLVSSLLRLVLRPCLWGIISQSILLFCSRSSGTQLYPHPNQSARLIPSYSFVVGLAITFRMQSSYSRWWEGREQWDKLSAVSRSFARTIWLHVPVPRSPLLINGPNAQAFEKLDLIRCICTHAVALKHHLRGEREWVECSDLKPLVAHLPNVRYIT